MRSIAKERSRTGLVLQRAGDEFARRFMRHCRTVHAALCERFEPAIAKSSVVKGSEIPEELSAGILAQEWHWYCWHAKNYKNGTVTPFFYEVMVSLSQIDDAMPGSAAEFVRRIASIASGFKNQADYDQLQQTLAEIHVLVRLVGHRWPSGTTIANAAAVGARAPDVEALVRTPGLEVAVEVKSPRIREWRNKMGEGIEVVARTMPLGSVEIATYPKDNAVKDAVASSDVKFHSLRAAHPDLLGILVLVWDGLMYEPISALLNPGSGLFTPNTFDPKKRTFDDVDAVLIVPHLSGLIAGPGNRDFRFADGTFQWPCKPVPPFVINPRSQRAAKVAEVLRDVFCAEDQATLDGPHYSASDLVIWIDPVKPNPANAEAQREDTPPA